MLAILRVIRDGILSFVTHVGAFGKLLCNTLIAFGDVRTYASLVIDQMMHIGIMSIPIVAYISLFMGMVTALQAVTQFTSTVPMYIAGTVVEKAVLQELASAMTGLVLAGRVGAAIAAEIGTMKVTEQIDALEAMAFNPVSYLVVPRLIAGMVMVPVLTIFSGVVSFVAGWFTAINMANLTTAEFFKGARLYAEAHDFVLPLTKSLLFGIAIIMVACYQGFNTREGAEGVGRATTKAVVTACLMILTLDYVMAKIILG